MSPPIKVPIMPKKKAPAWLQPLAPGSASQNDLSKEGANPAGGQILEETPPGHATLRSKRGQPREAAKEVPKASGDRSNGSACPRAVSSRVNFDRVNPFGPRDFPSGQL